MRVYICGAHSCGKSTLARYISKKYRLPMISEVARQVLSEQELRLDSMRSDLDTTDQYQSEVFKRQIQEEQSYENFVSDRTFDNLAYAAQHARVLSTLISSDYLKKYIEFVKEKDSFIFFIRPSRATLKEDGVRESINWDGVVAIDAMIKFMIEMWEIPYYQINTDNMQERVRLVDSILSLKS